jgi:hypothetical protein
VVEVADHAAVDRVELGKDPAEQAGVVELGEVRVKTWPWPQQVSNEAPLLLAAAGMLEGLHPSCRIQAALRRRAEAPRCVDGARYGTSPPEVLAHQRFNALLRRLAVESKYLGDTLLKGVTEHVLVPPVLHVEDRTDPQQEILRLFELAWIEGGIAVPLLARQLPDPAHRRNIAQAAGRLLDVRLELIKGAVERRVPLGRER